MAQQKKQTTRRKTKSNSKKKGFKFDVKLFKKIMLISLITIPTLVIVFYLSVYFGAFGSLPTKTALKNINHPLASEIFGSDNRMLGKYFVENRSQTEYDDLPPLLIQALIATEDTRFFKHSGVDFRSTMRVLFKSVLMMNRSSGGGSTISQQLAKNLYPRKSYWTASTLVNKTREIILAQRIEKVYSKEEILALYLNTVPFGENVFGIGVASERFFDKPPYDLSLEESALLVGMLKATTFYSPRKYPERSQIRRNVVLDQMLKYKYITPKEADDSKETPLVLKYDRRTDIEGPGMYFRAHVKNELKKWCADNLNEQGEPYNLYTDGLRIFTTIDPNLQRFAEESVKETLITLQKKFDDQLTSWKPYYKPLEDATKRSKRYKSLVQQGVSSADIQKIFAQPIPNRIYKEGRIEAVDISPIDSIKHYLKILQGSMLAMDPQNGAIRAYVGGIDHQHFGIDYVTTPRQVGSTFKPFVYGSALEEGFDPCWYYDNELRTYESYKNWAPKNSDGKYEGSYTMKGALTHSINTVSVQVLFDAGIENVIDFANRAGIKSYIPEVPSIALGTAEINLQDMVTAYSTIANQGVNVQPFYLLRIEDRHGNVLEDFTKDQYESVVLDHIERAFNDTTALELIHMMESVVNDGTAKRLRSQYGFKFDIAGKTGTTQNQSDGWFMGITPGLVVGAWVGANDRRIHFKTTSDGQGARTALPIWGSFFQKIEASGKYRSMLNKSFDPLPTFASYADFDCLPYSEFDAEYMNNQNSLQAELDEIFESLPNSKTKSKNRRTVEKKRSQGLKGILESIFGKKENKKKKRKKRKR